jgi:hypothetical protein
MQARSSYKGSSMQNEAAPYLAEYSQRKRLAKLGYTTNMSELTALKSEIFGIIDIELDKCQAEEMRQKNGRR